jgi:hypothetical protein
MALSLLILCQGCVSKREINAAIWLNNSPLPVEICERDPVLKQYGFYRRLNNGKFEFISFCDEKARNWLSMHKDDFNRIMDRINEPNDSKKAIKVMK